MVIGVFLRSAGEGVESHRKRHVLRCFYEGLLTEREDARLIDIAGYEPCEVAVVLGGRASTTRMATRTVRDEIFARHQGRFVFIETPLLGRRVYRRSPIVAFARKALRVGRKWYSDKYGYYRVGVGGFLQDDGDFNNAGSTPDRWKLLARTLGLRLKPYRREGRHVLIVGQNPGDASLRGTDILDWMYRTAVHARRVTERPIVVRPHPVTTQPMLAEFTKRFQELAEIVLDYPPTHPIRTTLKDCWAVLAFSSSATIDALIEGVPCVTFSPANFAWRVSDHSLERIERPTLFDREQWLYDLANAQWSPEEMRTGIVWRHLLPALARTRPAGTSDDGL